MYTQKAILMDAAAMDRTLMRIAHEILEKETDTAALLLAGICRKGVPLAAQLAENIRLVAGLAVPIVPLDIARHRDDRNPPLSAENQTTAFDAKDKIVILVDDVLFTGRTVRAALDALLAFGRPRAVRLAVLVDRGHRELPIRPDFVGKNIPTARKERIEVRLPEFDGVKEVAILGTA